MNITSEAKVGLLVIVAFALLTYFSVQLGELRLGRDSYYSAEFPFENVSGLNRGARVKMAGVTIGEVETIELDNGTVIVTALIDKNYPVARHAPASILTEGVLGEKYLSIDFVSGDEHLGDGQRSEHFNYSSGADDIMAALGKVAGDVSEITDNLKTSLGSPQTNENINEMIFYLRELSYQLHQVIVDNQDNVNRSMGNIAQITETLRDMTQRNERNIDALIENLEVLTRSLRSKTPGVMESADGAFRQADSAFGELHGILAENRMDIQESARNINFLTGELGTTSRNLSEITNKIRQGEGTLGKLATTNELHDSLLAASRGIEELTGNISGIRTDITVRPEFLTEHSETRGIFNVRLTPQGTNRFYDVGLVATPFGRDSRTVKRTRVYDHDTDSFTVDTTTTEDKNDYSFEFNALFGFVPRDNLEFRLGLLETTFGMGVSYVPTWFDNRLRFSAEAFDFSPRQEDVDTHLKFYSDIYLTENFHFTVGYDDPLNDDRKSPFAGVAFTFTDEYIKYLLGRMPTP
ncbi:MlaD family protein [Desulfurispira natronophila]|uniref:Phospholipid/cholesterol/gamma-HCH transport system substrate-binding protein n=1 Tax=Desulfurispira natronophila TaxID=682562 RepID=A0A7W7Y2A7_9BACT|nr:MlaD family protein [Desulfurispira natronophila]MBB5020752.1 phospholipid/cholesterol/gamma-HCH transport system substrate-binding protein [Desulfurispira natronophila]